MRLAMIGGASMIHLASAYAALQASMPPWEYTDLVYVLGPYGHMPAPMGCLPCLRDVGLIAGPCAGNPLYDGSVSRVKLREYRERVRTERERQPHVTAEEAYAQMERHMGHKPRAMGSSTLSDLEIIEVMRRAADKQITNNFRGYVIEPPQIAAPELYDDKPRHGATVFWRNLPPKKRGKRR